jgi:hypothetical protein
MAVHLRQFLTLGRRHSSGAAVRRPAGGFGDSRRGGTRAAESSGLLRCGGLGLAGGPWAPRHRLAADAAVEGAASRRWARQHDGETVRRCGEPNSTPSYSHRIPRSLTPISFACLRIRLPSHFKMLRLLNSWYILTASCYSLASSFVVVLQGNPILQ